ncbi:hypothetical protein LIER_25420 [Lithospermum erythrorhizon]|uniref:SWIM-type domain-containing protein n=1 Tax=Lithospermum erythrorhizon TaxID=34254 RepID=A0AAV3R7W9_LITER
MDVEDFDMRDTDEYVMRTGCPIGCQALYAYTVEDCNPDPKLLKLYSCGCGFRTVVHRFEYCSFWIAGPVKKTLYVRRELMKAQPGRSCYVDFIKPQVPVDPGVFRRLYGLEEVVHDILSGAARRNYFKMAMKKLKDFNENTHSWMIDYAEARDKPLITMLELIRSKFIERIKDRSAMSRKSGPLCVKVKRILDDSVKDCVGYIIKWNGIDGFRVKAHDEQFTIDIARMTCSCGSWQLSGIPCSHVIPCLYHLRKILPDYLNDCYKKSSFLSTYSHVLNPMSGIHLWDRTVGMPLQPLLHIMLDGRPKKLSRRDKNEVLKKEKTETLRK